MLNPIMNVRCPARIPCHHPFSRPRESPHTTRSTPSPAQTSSIALDLLTASPWHTSHIDSPPYLRIPESSHGPLLYCRSGPYLNLLINALSVQVHQYPCFSLSNTRFVPFHDPAHQFFAGIAVHGHAVIGVAGVTRRVWFEVPSPDLGVEGFGCT